MDDDDKTVFVGKAALPSLRPAPEIQITCLLSNGEKHAARFKETLRIGRDAGCGVHFFSDVVSRQHAELYFDGARWCVRDLNSGNGTYLDGHRVDQAPLPIKSTLQFGEEGPVIWLEIFAESAQTNSAIGAASDCREPVSAISKAPDTYTPDQADEIETPETLTQIGRRYFDASSDHEAGAHTIMVRKAFQQVKKKQSRRYQGVLTVVGLLLFISAGIGLYQYEKLQRSREIAIEMFYTMKTLDLQVSKIESTLKAAGAHLQQDEVASKRKQLAALEKQYDHFLQEFGVLSKNMSEEDRLIFKVARIFGECEVDMPKGFVTEVKRYIAKWKTTNRLPEAIERIRANHHAPIVYRAMVENNLPPQFLYLALQESSFNHTAVGPATRFGIAKGVWQFIPGTARQYGLKTGPLVEQAEYDPDDQRFDFELATQAAARFLRDIYNTDAQASALLVMASYNWGPNSILTRIRKMPENPRDRNFWKLLEGHKIPKETYDYVYYIFAAAVIGENPQLFGFDFENPLLQPQKALDSAMNNSNVALRVQPDRRLVRQSTTRDTGQ